MSRPLNFGVPDSSSRSILEWIQLAGLWVIAYLGFLYSHQAYSGYVFEDAYITFRYARNVAEGIGYVFNRGERVFGATSPLHTLTLAVCHYFERDIPTYAGIISALGLSLTGLIGGYILRYFKSPNAAMLFGILAVSSATRPYLSWGIETSMLTSLIFGSLLAALHKRDILAGVLAGLAFLTRYDAALFALLLFMLMFLRDRKVPWRPGLVASGIVLPWLLFAYGFFGAVLPNTLMAKMGDTSRLEYLKMSGIAQLTSIFSPFAGDTGSPFVMRNSYIFQGIAIGLLILYACRTYLRKDIVVRLMLFFPFALWTGYALIGPSFNFTWYLVPGAWCLILLSFLGAGALVPQSLLRRVRFAITVPAIATGLVLLPPFLKGQESLLISSSSYVGRIHAYRDIGDWIIDHGLTDTSLACAEPGYLTYRTGNRAIDAGGLVTKNDLFPANASKRARLAGLVRELRPDLAVVSIPERIVGYVPVFHAYPYKVLFASAALHQEHYDELLTEFEGDRMIRSEAPPLRHPFRLDADHLSKSQWSREGGVSFPDVRNMPLTLNGKPFDGNVFSVKTSRTGAETPPFLIDFDRIAFHFAATDPSLTRAQLIIGGRVVLERTGVSREGGEGANMELHFESWPVGHWRGQTATLRLVHVAKSLSDWIAIDAIHSVVDAGAVMVDDFELTDQYSDTWVSAFGRTPSDLAVFSRTHGVEFCYSRGAALSLGLAGRRVMVSRPFRIERASLSLLVFDFGRAEGMGVQLLVDGGVIASFVGVNSRSLRPVTWDVEAYRDREAVIMVVDNQPSPDMWIGVDDLQMFDEPFQSR